MAKMTSEEGVAALKELNKRLTAIEKRLEESDSDARYNSLKETQQELKAEIAALEKLLTEGADHDDDEETGPGFFAPEDDE